jgi:exonuclease SbcD
MRSLKIAHIADTHLGYRSGTISGRDEDFSKSWLFACQAIVDSSPDLILHAGDVFHHPNPSWGAVATFLEGARILRQATAPIFMISGNHDSSRMTMKHTIFSIIPVIAPHIHLSHDPLPVVYSLPELETDIVLLSHRALIQEKLQENLNDAVSRLSADRHAILVSHGSVGNLESSKELGSVVIPDSVFEYPWSYVALGHLHMAQPYGQAGWYSGSIERCGWSDYSGSPAWTLTSLGADRRVRHSQQALPHLEMIQLPEFQASSFSNDEIVNEVLFQLDRLPISKERRLVRVVVKGISPNRQRALQSSSRRRVKERYPLVLFQLKVDGAISLMEPPTMNAPTDRTMTVEDLFRDYVAGRVYVDPTFGDRFLEKGMETFEKVRIASLEADTGDERTTPTG